MQHFTDCQCATFQQAVNVQHFKRLSMCSISTGCQCAAFQQTVNVQHFNRLLMCSISTGCQCAAFQQTVNVHHFNRLPKETISAMHLTQPNHDDSLNELDKLAALAESRQDTTHAVNNHVPVQIRMTDEGEIEVTWQERTTALRKATSL